jgi:hypothetical protein
MSADAQCPGLTAVLDHPIVRFIARLLVLATYAWAGLAMIAGQDLLTNPIFGFVFVWMWVGLVPISFPLGQFWRATNPVRTIHRGLCAVARIDPQKGLLTVPAAIGVWPAAIGLFNFGWLELVQPDRTTLPVLRLWALAWLVILILGAIVFGQSWIGATDPFEVYASTLAQMSIFQHVGDQLRLLNPLAGLNSWQAPPGATAVVAALLGGTAFDSFTNTTWWIPTVQNSTTPATLWGTGGLLTMITIVSSRLASQQPGWAAMATTPPRPIRDTWPAPCYRSFWVMWLPTTPHCSSLNVSGSRSTFRPARSRLERLRISRDGRELRNLQPSNSDRRNAGMCHRRRPHLRHHLCTRESGRATPAGSCSARPAAAAGQGRARRSPPPSRQE